MPAAKALSSSLNPLRKIVIMFIMAFLGCGLFAQQGNKRDNYPILELKKLKASYEKALTEYQQKKKGHEYGIISDLELNAASLALTNQEVEYHKSLLSIVFEEQYVSIVSGMKYQGKDGRKHVRITLNNTSGGGSEYAKELALDEKLFKALQSDIIFNVYVSLSDDEKSIISSPYEAKIDRLHFGKPVDLDFTMLRDLDAVTVNLTYGNGTKRDSKISLVKDETFNKVVIQSEQFSQEALLGESATFDLKLELFSGLDDTYQLEVVNLPPELNRYFSDPQTQARLSQFKFTEGNNSRKASLKVDLPDRPSSAIEVGKRIPFFALVIPNKRANELASMQGRIWTEKDIEALGIGFVPLELLPRGVGKLVARAQQMYFSAKKGQTVSITLDLKNEGTQPLANIEVKVDPPMNWLKKIEPQLIRKLDVNQEEKITIAITPPQNIEEGKYEIKIEPTGLSDTKPVKDDEKTFSVEIKGETNVMGIAIIVGAIVILVLGIVIFGIRLSRR